MPPFYPIDLSFKRNLRNLNKGHYMFLGQCGISIPIQNMIQLPEQSESTQEILVLNLNLKVTRNWWNYKGMKESSVPLSGISIA